MKHSALDYTYSVARIRSLEKYLITSAVFDEAIRSDGAAALRLFVETGRYEEGLAKISKSRELEDALDREVSKLKTFVTNLILDKELLGILEMRNVESCNEIVESYPSEFLQQYLRRVIDMHNIKTFLRLYVLKEPIQELGKNITATGYIGKDIFMKLYEHELPVFINRLEYIQTGTSTIDYAYFLDDAIYRLEKEKDFISLERAINDLLIHELKKTRYIVFGPEPVIAYYCAKRNEINIIRMIMLTKLNNLPDTIMKEGLNAVYA
jgi:vacuolar-type H+-ATPase subunit C/Vma6